MIDLIKALIDFILHIDQHLVEIVSNYQQWTYLILFLIIFCETGLVVTPFLPGDSLLFATGAIVALPGSGLSLITIIILLIIAAFLGDTVNYYVGKSFGPKVFVKDYRFLKKDYLIKTQKFYNEHGGKTIIFARFVPIIRTFAPFIAGVGEMNYKRFLTFNIVGGILWIVIFTLAGYFFGNIPAIRSNFTLVIFGIIFISLIPAIVGIFKASRS